MKCVCKCDPFCNIAENDRIKGRNQESNEGGWVWNWKLNTCMDVM